jgi:hypothetical protein
MDTCPRVGTTNSFLRQLELYTAFARAIVIAIHSGVIGR